MGAKKNVDMSAQVDEIKVLAEHKSETAVRDSAENAESAKNAQGVAGETENQGTATAAVVKKSKPKRVRGKKYVAGRSLVDRTKEYDVFAAVELVKKSSYAKFDASITADINVRDLGEQAKLTLPHSSGKSVRVAIADDKLLADIEAGKIDFDVLLAKPALMPKLAKLARTLGPKGLMPNPKNGTLTDKPEAKKKELEGGAIVIKTERKTPVTHIVVGKTSMETKDLVENVNTLISTLGTKVLKLTLSATMGPGVKVKVVK